MITNEGQLIWNRFNVMFAANSFIILLLGTIFSATRNSNAPLVYALIPVGSLFGLVLCLQWYRLTNLGWKISKMWVAHPFVLSFNRNACGADNKSAHRDGC